MDRFQNDLLQRSIESTAEASGTPVTEITQRNIEAIARMEKDAEASRTLGERLADRFAAIVGSWTFIAIQSFLLLVWMVFNILAWSYHWDPYPFILLNLALSFQAAFATPVIMMSQNRQARLAEKRNRLDLQINLLAEQENTELLRMVRKLCEKAGIASHEGNTSLEQDTPAEVVAQQIEEANAPEPPQK
ncbi:MAG TPA: DUF1003 domain-containing protein [Pirellulales bacterium]